MWQNADRVNFNTYVVRDVKNYIPNSDFALTNGTSLLSDNIHFDGPSAKLLGQRFAEKIIQNIYASTDNKTIKKNEKLQFAQDGKQLTINNSGQAGTLQIIDARGRQVFEQKIASQSTLTHLLPRGMYLIRFVENAKAATTTDKIFIR